MKKGLKFYWFAVLLLANVTFTGCTQVQVSTSRENTKKVYAPAEKEQFSFVILGVCTGGDFTEGLEVMTEAVREINVLGPEFVFTVGDLIPGYDKRSAWMEEAKAYREVVDSLEMEWYPVAGNHDVYWWGEGKPKTEHEEDFERVFGPLWYSFEYKGCLFIALFSDEGDPVTGAKSFNDPANQKMSPRQMTWLKETLNKVPNIKHVFLFLHHPRWRQGNYGKDWEKVHKLLKEAGNVRAVFAGHVHKMRYDGRKDGIQYYTLGTTGGGISEGEKKRGGRHHYLLVNVTEKDYSATVIPVGTVRSAVSDMVKVLKPRGNWHISKDSERKIEYHIAVEDYGARSVVLRAGVRGGADDSGDRGAWMYLVDAEKKVIKKQFTKSDKVEWLTADVQQGHSYYVIIEDTDTAFNGRNPGNAGSVEVRAIIKD